MKPTRTPIKRIPFSILGLFLMPSLLLLSCKDFIEIDPSKAEILTMDVFSKDATAHVAMTSIYARMVADRITGISVQYTGLYSDELKFHYPNSVLLEAVYSNNLDGNTNAPVQMWNQPFTYIYQANAVIEGCLASGDLTSATKEHLVAEARFIRAYWYFMLTNFYGNVPILLSTDYQINAKETRQAQEHVYDQILEDLEAAEAVLPIEYVNGAGNSGTNERLRPNKATVWAMLARVHLYRGDMEKAASMASLVIEQTSLYDTVGVENVYLKNSREAIWQLSPDINGFTPEASVFYPLVGPRGGILTDNLLNAFEEGDRRREAWVGLYNNPNDSPISIDVPYPFKYKDRTANSPEYTNMFRLAELYLIRAEARARLNDLEAAKADINILRQRAGLSFIDLVTSEQILESIIQERRIELFVEGCHRWFDLKRMDRLDAAMDMVASEKNATWSPYKQFWPISQQEIDKNPNLNQTAGYNSIPN